MNNMQNLRIPNSSVHFKKVARAIAKNKGISFGRLFRNFAADEIKKFDIDQYSNPHIGTDTSEFFVKNIPETLKLQIDRVARAYGLSYTEFSRVLIIMLVNSAPKENKTYKPDVD